jgi:pilus assembly protein Flp/PilA
MSLLRRLWAGESGQDLIEYALLAALIAVVTVVALQTLGVSVSGFYNNLNTKLASM